MIGKKLAVETVQRANDGGGESLPRILMWGVFLRLLVATWNTWVGPTPGADLDALGAHMAAQAVANSGEFLPFKMGTTQYINFLAGVYVLLCSSQFVGAAMSVLAWYVGAKALLEVTRLMAFGGRQRELATMIYCFMPSAILLTGVTLRESYQMALLNLAVLYFLRACLRWGKHNWLYFLACISVAGTLHGALLASGILFAVLAVVCHALLGRRVKMDLRVVPLAVMAVGILVVGVNFFTTFSYDLSDGLLSAVELYQDRLLSVDARTHYKEQVNIGSGTDMVLYFAWSLVQYWLEPFPWRPLTGADVVLVAENVVRLALMVMTISNIRTAQGSERRILIFLALSYLIIELTWSFGTINWGTALRHHLPSFGMLVVLGCAYRPKGTR
ncbi:MAG: hypothetical protein Q7U28_10910 [Aquabacterium sp.]|nr:hypothetical protein [Aquabacterium sp.]